MATWGNPTIDNLKRVADKIAGKGIQYLVMDSGWYSDCGNWWEYRGDWSINRKRFPNGLKELADYIRGKGMMYGVESDISVNPIINRALLDEHIVLINAGTNILRIIPALIITKEIVDEAIDKIDRAITAEEQANA